MKRIAAVALAVSTSLSLSVADANGTSGQGVAANTSSPGALSGGRVPGSGAGSAAAGAAAEGKKIFASGTTPSCATCHALRDAGATGNIGPDLDVLKPDAARVRNAVQKGFENMPAFGHVLSAAQVDAVAQYVEQATKTAK
jgi:mono/diheme cytochrome c family protein